MDTEESALIISSNVYENYLCCKNEAVSVIFYFRFFFYVLKK